MIPGACELERVHRIMRNVATPRSLGECDWHPLIHTSARTQVCTIYWEVSSDWARKCPHWPVQLPRPVRAKGWIGYVLPQHTLPAEHLTTRGVKIESPSTLCLSRIEGLVKSPLTDTDHLYGWSQAYGDLGLMSPLFIVCRIGDVAQFCQYEKPPF